MDDIFDLLGQGLTIFAVWLDKVFHPVPWPLVVGALFLPLVAAVRTLVWIMRGRAWPVACKYYYTTQRRRDKPCRQVVAGEWVYCRHHKRARVLSDGHRCDPSVPRWRRKDRQGRLVDRSDIRGVGFVSLMSNRETLLFYKGVAKRPRDVIPSLRRYRQKFRQDWEAIKGVSFRSLVSGGTVIPQGVTARMPRVVQATRISLLFAAVALAFVIVSAVVGGDLRRWVQYCSTALFVYAWNFFRFGAWKPPGEESRWLKSALVDSSKAMSVMIALGFVAGILENVNQSIGTAHT